MLSKRVSRRETLPAVRSYLHIGAKEPGSPRPWASRPIRPIFGTEGGDGRQRNPVASLLWEPISGWHLDSLAAVPWDNCQRAA
jgi:hypothetical protein